MNPPAGHRTSAISKAILALQCFLTAPQALSFLAGGLLWLCSDCEIVEVAQHTHTKPTSTKTKLLRRLPRHNFISPTCQRGEAPTPQQETTKLLLIMSQKAPIQAKVRQTELAGLQTQLGTGFYLFAISKPEQRANHGLVRTGAKTHLLSPQGSATLCSEAPAECSW